MNIIKRGEIVIVTQGQHVGKVGHVMGLIGHLDSLMVEVQLESEPQSTFHRTWMLSRNQDKQ